MLTHFLCFVSVVRVIHVGPTFHHQYLSSFGGTFSHSTEVIVDADLGLFFFISATLTVLPIDKFSFYPFE